MLKGSDGCVVQANSRRHSRQCTRLRRSSTRWVATWAVNLVIDSDWCAPLTSHAFGGRQTKVKSIKKKVASDACIGACTCYPRPARRHAPTASLCRTYWATDVTFNEQESWKRCILDYGRYKGWCVCVGTKARAPPRVRPRTQPNLARALVPGSGGACSCRMS